MRLIALVGVVILLASAPVIDGGPVGGGMLEKVEKSPWKVTMKFRGGEKATVLARAGSPDSKAKLHLTISDANGKTIVEAAGKNPPSAGMVAVFWYPPRDGDYHIELKTADNEPTTCYVTIK